MVEQVQNIIEQDKKEGVKRPPSEELSDLPKCKVKPSDLLRRYPVCTTSAGSISSDPESLAKHESAMNAELAKSKPRDTVLLPLMKSTYHNSRNFILKEATSVASILSKYPALSSTAAVVR